MRNAIIQKQKNGEEMEPQIDIKKIMDRRSWSVTEMAEYFGVNYSTAWRWVNKEIPKHGAAYRLLTEEWKKIEKRGK